MPPPRTYICVPSRDASGKRLSGGAQKRKATERRAGAAGTALVHVPKPGPAPPVAASRLASLPMPPYGSGHSEGVVWAQRAMALAAAETSDDAETLRRVRLVCGIVTAMGKLRAAARDSERAVLALGHYRGEQIDVFGDAPPEQPVAVAVWAFWALCNLLHTAATCPPDDETALCYRVRALATVGAVFPSETWCRLVAELDAEAPEAEAEPGATDGDAEPDGEEPAQDVLLQ